MKYVRGFFDFWRKFIVGDDSRIAVVIMWSLLFIDSLTRNFINSWFVLPVIVLLLLSFLAYDAISIKSSPKTRLSPTTLLLMGTIPMLLVVALPPLLSRGMSGTWDAKYTLLPLGIYIVITTFVTVVAGWVLRIFPMLTLFVLGLVSFALITYWQGSLNRFSQDVAGVYSAAATLFSLLILIGFLAGCFVLLSRRKNS